MEVLMWIIAGVLVLSSVLMCVVVLVQQTKSSGIGAGFGETVSFSQRGKKASREAKLQKITVVLAIVIAVLAIALLLIKCFAGVSL